ncbi:bifunctional 2-polyprenyl-6-hydroxyphenol methylase/3-demethylubiquinol 3-O-methyltransferase UbiG [Bordetella sp. LUAb4]|uniref:class I SAM-dependent methyltransferase n=1 Tax=Bordetella sp. LUAb4 TaxID=2843195 RepID=UPI001E28ADA7|nr:class I SAM-dependent methyltransferase [Bordetella sp. LUAb4]
MAAVDTAYFEQLYAQQDDPWGVSTHWYEARKRALLLACLPSARLGRVYEPGCANGVLTQALAQRADHVFATDLSQQALNAARVRLDRAGVRNVTLARAVLPEDWPVADRHAFDLIVLSELGYYFDALAWDCMAARAVASLAPGGTIVACHWLHPFGERRLDTHVVHGAIARQPALHPLADHAEQDFLLQVWSRDPASLACKEGLA